MSDPGFKFMLVRLPAATIAYLKANGYWGWVCEAKLERTTLGIVVDGPECRALNFYHKAEIQHCWRCGVPREDDTDDRFRPY
jgi:hypothetical protein